MTAGNVSKGFMHGYYGQNEIDLAGRLTQVRRDAFKGVQGRIRRDDTTI